MPQQQCPWCGHCGPRYQDGTPPAERPSAHSDGSMCVCRHVTTDSPESAYEHGGRYYDRLEGRWICLAGCHPDAATPVIRELERAARRDETPESVYAEHLGVR